MISPSRLFDELKSRDVDFYTGVPDSLLKNLCAYITDHLPASQHIIAANEGGAVALAAGYYLATGKIPVVYMQNSGLGNTVNPLMSLTDKLVYKIPVLLIIGWRGEPGVKDEPQHRKQGLVTIPLLETLGIEHEIMVEDESLLPAQVERAVSHMSNTGEAFALVVRKGTFDDYMLRTNQESALSLNRERAIELITSAITDRDVIVSTTGKTSRELFEYRTALHQGHQQDFLTVGSMGHASQIALGIALNQPDRNVYCFDGDGATIMHMGNMAIIGTVAPENYYHIVFNNGAHDSVGGQPTVGFKVDIPAVAKALGYKTVVSVDNEEDLISQLRDLTNNKAPLLFEVKVLKGARKDLGRPTTTPIENKEALMSFLLDK
ncbi:MAG: phosphonopyruvate decarboxylase [Muribaculaceae bacterium]|nr:phosphonopyruvate decarboxylase [Muribaculaceae bacterium]